MSVFTTYKAILLVMISALVVGMVLGGESVLSQVIINVSQATSTVLLVLYLCDKSHRFGWPAVFLLAAGRFCTSLTTALGGAVPSLVGGTHSIAFYGLALVTVVASLFFWLSDGRPGEEALRAEGGGIDGNDGGCIADAGAFADAESVLPPIPEIGPAAPGRESSAPAATDVGRLMAELVEARCAALSEEYRLSARESEVLELLAWGRSAKRIEDALTLSPDTVKIHVRHIYSKMGIHSRAELDRLLSLGRES